MGLKKVRNMKYMNIKESANVCKSIMPKEMSDWFDERLSSGQCAFVEGKDGNNSSIGIAAKSRDCTVVLFPNWNCDQQFKKAVNKLR